MGKFSHRPWLLGTFYYSAATFYPDR